MIRQTLRRGYSYVLSNVHVDFPLLQRIALPITKGSVRYPGIKIHETRVIRLMEVLLHGGTQVGGWTAKEIHEAVLITFDLSEKRYRLNQLRYDLRKLKGHGLLERDGSHLPPHHQRRRGRSPVPLLSQAPMRTSRQQPLPSSTRSPTPTRQPVGGCLPSCRCGDPESRRFARRSLTRRP